jgi:hypothetical protein
VPPQTQKIHRKGKIKSKVSATIKTSESASVQIDAWENKCSTPSVLTGFVTRPSACQQPAIPKSADDEDTEQPFLNQPSEFFSFD